MIKIAYKELTPAKVRIRKYILELKLKNKDVDLNIKAFFGHWLPLKFELFWAKSS